jgi:Ni,Fe-hydrogenase I small subunit
MMTRMPWGGGQTTALLSHTVVNMAEDIKVFWLPCNLCTKYTNSFLLTHHLRTPEQIEIKFPLTYDLICLIPDLHP